MIAWKIFAAFSVVMVAVWIGFILGDEKIIPEDIAGLPIELIATYGLTTFAFSLRSLPRQFWRVFHPIYAVYVAWDLAISEIDWGLNFETVVAVLVWLAIGFFSWLALFRLADRETPLLASPGAGL